jgi:hypothetical protein
MLTILSTQYKIEHKYLSGFHISLYPIYKSCWGHGFTYIFKFKRNSSKKLSFGLVVLSFLAIFRIYTNKK